MNNFQSWAADKFTKFGYQDSDKLVKNVLEINQVSGIKEYLNSLLDNSDSDQTRFINQFLFQYNKLKSLSQIKARENVESEKSQNVNKKQLALKKKKFVPLFTDGKETEMIVPGRHKCDCQATKHKLVSNCLKCGRIVCQQEGSGPCVFCNNLVMSKSEKQIITKGSKASEALHNQLLKSKIVIEESNESGLRNAIDHKNKLLNFDKTSEQRTKVVDDESDYFQSNSKWINPEKREKLKQLEEEWVKKKYDRKNKRMVVDLLGRKVSYEDEEIKFDPSNPIYNELMELSNQYDAQSFTEHETDFQALNLSHPVYVRNETEKDELSSSINVKKDKIFSFAELGRIQDREIQEMRDEGKCLSMHQPWASLLVAGVKTHEGRTWYHTHRGRLWIASTTQTPSHEEITQWEEHYRLLHCEGKPIESDFPQYYPAGCLLGFVDVLEVLPQEEYRRQFPDGESECPYVFICSNAHEMKVKFPIKGEHKIYKLDSKIHQAAMKTLKM